MQNFTKFLILNLFFVCTLAKAQQKDTLKINYSKNGAISFAKFSPSLDRVMINAKLVLKKMLEVGQNVEFRLQEETTDKYGITHLRFHQYYNGIKVEGAEYLVHGENGFIEIINGNYEKVNLSSVSPQLTEQ